MVGSRQSKRVSWASGANLCKVRLFLSEDSPSQARLRPQDNLQAKGSWLLHAAGPSSDDSLPPGFESLQPTNDFKLDISQIPQIRWRCPPHILLTPDWCIVAGEESEEIAIQNERMFGALEAIYPRPSNIPPNPFVSPDVKDSHYDDSQTPSVPLIPVEDDDASDQLEELPLNSPTNFHQSDKYSSAEIRMSQVSTAPAPTLQQQPCGSSGAIGAGLSAEPDVMAAASAAFTAIMQSNEQGSMIDRDLLVKILSDPAQIERLMKEYGTTIHERSATISFAAPMPPDPPPQMTASTPTTFSDPMATFRSINPTLPPPPPVVNRLPPPIPPVSMNHTGLSPAMNDMNYASAPVKGMNYYKSLIHQHGGEKQEPQDQQAIQFGKYQRSAMSQTGSMDVVNGGAMVGRDAKARVMKPCAYFNSPRGCRNGSSCSFLHDASAPTRKEQPKGQKRIKLDSGIAGRN